MFDCPCFSIVIRSRLLWWLLVGRLYWDLDHWAGLTGSATLGTSVWSCLDAEDCGGSYGCEDGLSVFLLDVIVNLRRRLGGSFRILCCCSIVVSILVFHCSFLNARLNPLPCLGHTLAILATRLDHLLSTLSTSDVAFSETKSHWGLSLSCHRPELVWLFRLCIR